jgi:predicted GNAT family acetyltransferase
MTIEVVDEPQHERFVLYADGTVAGIAEYRRRPGLLAFTHTEIAPEFEGQGLGSQLARAALDQARADGLGVLPFCPFFNGWIAKHPDYIDLVPSDMRKEFDL